MCVVERKRESDGVCVYVLDDALVVSLCVRARVCTYTHSVVYVCMYIYIYIYIYICVCVCAYNRTTLR